jgi:YD repeat-containing protein
MCPTAGNPCGIGSGSKHQIESVNTPAIASGAKLTLAYNSSWVNSLHPKWIGVFGNYWFGSYERRVYPSVEVSGRMGIKRPNGREYDYGAPASGNVYVPDADIADKLERLVNGANAVVGWKLTSADGDDVELYDSVGARRLLSITRRNGLVERLSYSNGAGGILYGASPNPAGFQAPACIPPVGFTYWPVAGATMPAGLLSCVTDHWGRQLHFGYDSSGLVVKMADGAGNTYLFEYNGPSAVRWRANDPAPRVLTKITFPGGETRTYYYNEQNHINDGGTCQNLPAIGLPYALTGIGDENQVRYANYKYDCNGRPVLTEHAGSVQRVTLAYTDNASGGIVATAVTDPLGTVRNYSFTSIQGVNRNTGLSHPTPDKSPQSRVYDLNGFLASETDWNGNLTTYLRQDTYGRLDLETSRTEGSGGPQARTITTQWHPTFRLPTLITEPGRTTAFTHDAKGNILTRTITDTATSASRTWIYTWSPIGQMLTQDGPRTDVADITTYTYYPDNDPDLGKRGNIATVTNAAGHITGVSSYDANGRPLTIVDPNGLVTTLTYHPRGWLTSRSVGGETTTYEYDFVGQLKKVTLPDTSFLQYTYDAAHRLTEIADNLGNKIVYTLDAMGNRTKEDVLDPFGSLAQTRSRVYNSLNRLTQDIGGTSPGTQITQYGYDNQGNLTTIDGPLAGAVDITTNGYDALNRLKQVTDPGSGLTQYTYNALDQLTAVTDPRNNATTYSIDGLDNLSAQVSPDTGTTLNTHDAAGNLLSSTDAKGQVTAYLYDALNRVTRITYHDASQVNYSYDTGVNGKGRLASIVETAAGGALTSQILYAYDIHSRLSSETRFLGSAAFVTQYGYDAAGRMNAITYPSGRVISYSFDAAGKISGVSTTPAGGSAQSVVANAAYHPFGGVKSYTFGNGQTYNRSIDLDGRIAGYTLANASYTVGFDAASRIASITNPANAADTRSFGYDVLDRLTSAVMPTTNHSFTYDPVGNRSTKTVGTVTATYAYPATSNKLASVSTGATKTYTHDAAGSITSDATNTFTYDTRGRLIQAATLLGNVTYGLNSLGQRYAKTVQGVTTLFHYDAQGHLIAETDPGGNTKVEYLYLGDIPVAIWR